MKRLWLLACTTFYLQSAQMPIKPPVASLESLPIDLKREMLRINALCGSTLNIDALAKGILNLAGTNTALRAQVNNFENIVTILNALPQSATIYLIEKLALLQVIQKNMLTILQMLPRSGAAYLGKALSRTPAIRQDDVKKWLQSISLENGQELYSEIAKEHPDVTLIANFLKNPNINLNFIGDLRGSITTSLMRASQDGKTEIVRMLLDAGANVNEKNEFGTTALMLASDNGHIEIVKLLLAHGALVNAATNSRGTALMRASAGGHLEVAKLLVAAGADIYAKMNKGMTARYFAQQYHHYSILDFLDKVERAHILANVK